MSRTTTDLFEKIKQKRNLVMEYGLLETNHHKIDKYGFFVRYFTIENGNNSYYFFPTEEERDDLIQKLDELFKSA